MLIRDGHVDGGLVLLLDGDGRISPSLGCFGLGDDDPKRGDNGCSAGCGGGGGALRWWALRRTVERGVWVK